MYVPYDSSVHGKDPWFIIPACHGRCIIRIALCVSLESSFVAKIPSLLLYNLHLNISISILVDNNIATRNDNFYAWRCLEALGIDTDDGVGELEFNPQEIVQSRFYRVVINEIED